MNCHIRISYINQPPDAIGFSTNQKAETRINQSQFAGRSYKMSQADRPYPLSKYHLYYCDIVKSQTNTQPYKQRHTQRRVQDFLKSTSGREQNRRGTYLMQVLMLASTPMGSLIMRSRNIQFRISTEAYFLHILHYQGHMPLSWARLWFHPIILLSCKSVKLLILPNWYERLALYIFIYKYMYII